MTRRRIHMVRNLVVPVAEAEGAGGLDDEDGGAGRGVRLVLDASRDGEDRAPGQDDRALARRFTQADAEAGVLDGRRATTHWRWAEALRELHPTVRPEPDVRYGDEGDLLSSAGSAASLDLGLHIWRWTTARSSPTR